MIFNFKINLQETKLNCLYFQSDEILLVKTQYFNFLCEGILFSCFTILIAYILKENTMPTDNLCSNIIFFFHGKSAHGYFTVKKRRVARKGMFIFPS